MRGTRSKLGTEGLCSLCSRALRPGTAVEEHSPASWRLSGHVEADQGAELSASTHRLAFERVTLAPQPYSSCSREPSETTEGPGSHPTERENDTVPLFEAPTVWDALSRSER